MIDLQVTTGAAATPIYSGSRNFYASFLIIQNNSAGSIRFGGPTVTSSRGILIANGTPPGSATMQFNFPRGACLNNLFIFGTAGLVIDVVYEPSE